MIPASLPLVAAVVLAPGLIFQATFLQQPLGALAALLALASVVPLFRRAEWRRPDPTFAMLAVAAAVALTLFAGVGHLFFQTDDWTTREAVLLDLQRNSWPVAYATDRGEALLRAPLGMYLVPAAVGRLLGPVAGDVALFAQNAGLFALCLYAFATSFESLRARWIAIPFFVVFSGLDSIAWAKRLVDGTPSNLVLPHLDPWPGALQFSSHVTQFFWAPNHALAGWALVVFYLAWRAGRIPALLMGPAWAASIFWSPLAALGAIPFLVFAFVWDVKDGKLRIADFATSFAAGAAALPVLFYFTRDGATVEKGFLNFADMEVLRSYVAMIMLKVAPWLAVAWQAVDRRDRKGVTEFWLIVAALLLIPTYKMGFANDFAMRVSIPALALLCLRVVPALAALGAEPVSRRAIVVGFVLMGAVTPAVEIMRNVTQESFEASACTLVDALIEPPEQALYLASSGSFASPPGLFAPPPGAPVAHRIADCWPGRSFVYAGSYRPPTQIR